MLTSSRRAVVCTLLVVLAASAAADDAPPKPAPTAQELAAAKQAFVEGDALYKAGKLEAAVEKMLESYQLSRNAFLLYNIGRIYDQLGRTELVRDYYQRFLADAPPDAPMRADVEKRVAELAAAAPIAEETVAAASAVTIEHVLVESAPPGLPLDVVATVEDPALTLSLHFRGSGDVAYTTRPMQLRGKDRVGHIPGARTTGSWVQYYLEARSSDGALVARSGRAISPHLTTLERGARPHYFADQLDPGEVVAPPPIETRPGSSGPADAGEGSARRVIRWSATGATAALLVTSIVAYRTAGNAHDALVADAGTCGVPPCRTFDADLGQRLEARGERYDTIYKVTLGASLATAALATYLWIRELRRPGVEVRPTAATRPQPPSRWSVGTTVGPAYRGVSAGVSF